MTFAWQGFALDHPDDWAPVALSGRRDEGYARIASPAKSSFQIRWQKVRKPGSLEARLDDYFSRLERDARHARQRFTKEIEDLDGRLMYRWSGAGQGRGSLFYSADCSRVFIVEAVSARKESLASVAQPLLKSFRSAVVADREEWSLFGLSLRLPRGLSLERKQLRAGRTDLHFAGRGVKVWAARWGFGEQLVQKHGLEPWARAALGAPRAIAVLGEERIELVSTGSLLRPAERSLAAYQADRNQLVTIRATSRSDTWRPEWDWLT